MLTINDIKNIIQETVIGFDVDSLDESQDFSEAGIDSLDHLSILLALEEKFDINKIPDEDIDLCSSIAGILSYLKSE